VTKELLKIGVFVENGQKIKWIVTKLKWPWCSVTSECFMKLVELFGWQNQKRKSRLEMTSAKFTFILCLVYWNLCCPTFINLLSMLYPHPSILEIFFVYSRRWRWHLLLRRRSRPRSINRCISEKGRKQMKMLLLDAESTVMAVPVALSDVADKFKPDMIFQMLPMFSITPCCSFACCLDVSEATAIEEEVVAHLCWDLASSSLWTSNSSFTAYLQILLHDLWLL